MRQEDKEVDGPDIEQAEERKRASELVEEKPDALYDLDNNYETTVDPQQRDTVISAMRMILEGDIIVVNDLQLSKRHLLALEALKTAVEGRDQEISQFVYAEDRRTLLEQSLAVLQPEIAAMDHLDKPFADLLKTVSALREKLDTLEDAEEELVEGRFFDGKQAESDSDDKPKPEEDDEDEDADADDTSLTGPERHIVKPPSSLTGPERAAPPKGPTTLGDPGEIEKARGGSE